MTISLLDNTPENAVYLGLLVEPIPTLSGTISSQDRDDYYTFLVTGYGRFSMNLGGFFAGDDIELRLLDSDQSPIRFVLNGLPPNLAPVLLDPGIYYLRLSQQGAAGDPVNYNLGINFAAIENPFAAAGYYGLLTEPLTIHGEVSDYNQPDYYRFELDQTTELTLTLTGITANTDVDLWLQNRREDTLFTSVRSSNADEIITIPAPGLPAGTYYVKVEYIPQPGSLPGEFSDTPANYTLNITPAGAGPILAIEPLSALKSEGTGSPDTPFTFRITRPAGSTGTTSIARWQVDAAAASSADPSDFRNNVFPSGTISFAANETVKTVTAFVKADSTPEASEDFIISLSAVSGASGTTSLKTTIQNDDSVSLVNALIAEWTTALALIDWSAVNPALLLAPSPESPTEFSATRIRIPLPLLAPGQGGAGQAILEITGQQLLSPSGSVSRVALLIGADTRASATLRSVGLIPLINTISQDLNDDRPGLDASSFKFLIDNLVIGNLPTLAIRAVAASLAEGNRLAPTPFTFTVTRSSFSAGDSSVAWSAGPPTSIVKADNLDFQDFVWPSGTVTFTGNELVKTITANVLADSIVESDERFIVSLSNPIGAAIDANASSATVTITNDDNFYSIAALDAVKVEATAKKLPAAGTPFTFRVTTPEPSRGQAILTWRVTSSGDGEGFANSADFRDDNAFPTGTITFAKGDTSKTITVLARPDSAAEADEAFSVVLQGLLGGEVMPNASTASGIIRNDDGRLSISALQSSLSEGNGADPSRLTFTITRALPSTDPCSVVWAVSSAGSERPDAASPSDFVDAVFPTGTVSFAPGETVRTITLNVKPDTDLEKDEVFSIQLSAPTRTSIDPRGATAFGTIRNDDTALAISPLSASKKEGTASSATPFTFLLTRTGNASGVTTVRWDVRAGLPSDSDVIDFGPAADSADFAGNLLPSGTIRFAANETQKTVTVSVNADNTREPSEAFHVQLTNPSVGTILDPDDAVALGMITNDDIPTLRISAFTAKQNEGNRGPTPFTYVLARSGDLTVQSVVNWGFLSSLAAVDQRTDRDDFVTPGGGRITFLAGESFRTLTVNVMGDTIKEKDETFRFYLDSPVEAQFLADSNLSSNSGVYSVASTIVNDDVNAPPVITYKNTAIDAAQIGIPILASNFFDVTDAQRTVPTAYILESSRGAAFSYRNATSKDAPLIITAAELPFTYFTLEPGSMLGAFTVNIKAFDGVDWSLDSYREFTIANPDQPILRGSDQRFIHEQAGRAVAASQFLTYQDSNGLKTLFILDENTDANSGYFMSAGQRLEPFAAVTSLADLTWIPGVPGTSDSIKAIAFDQFEAVSDEVSFKLETALAPTTYSILSATGFKHVTEGQPFVVNINKLTNLNGASQLQYYLQPASSNGNESVNRSDFPPNKTFEPDVIHWEKWMPVPFDQNVRTAQIIIPTRQDFIDEPPETARIWIYNPEKDNKKNFFENPAYTPIDFQVHDSPVHVLGNPTMNEEGETALMSVGRFGGYATSSFVRLRTRSLAAAYGLTGSNDYLTGAPGFASDSLGGGGDFVSPDKLIAFSRDTDAERNNPFAQYSTADILVDSDVEPNGEVFMWELFQKERKKVGSKFVDVDVIIEQREGTILDRPAPPVARAFAAQRGLMRQDIQTMGFAPLDWLADFTRNFVYGLTQAIGSVGALFSARGSSSTTQAVAAAKSVEKIRGSNGTGRVNFGQIGSNPTRGVLQAPRSVLLTRGGAVALGGALTTTPQALNNLARVERSPGNSLIGVEGGNLIGPDAGTLIGPDGGTLIGPDGGTLIGPDGGTLVGVDGTPLIGIDGGSLSAQLRGSAIAFNPASLIGPDAGTIIGIDGGSLIGVDGGSLRPPTFSG